jgi:solute carrier family 7 (L-type amino acid transporter), member 6
MQPDNNLQQAPRTVVGANPRVMTVPDETQSLLSEALHDRQGDHVVSAGPGTYLTPTEADTRSHISQSTTLPDRPRSLTLLNGLALVIGMQVGSGIFSSPSAIFTGVGSTGSALLIWLLAGVLAWTGAASFTELGSIVPLNGGVQEYLRYCYNDTCGFLTAWTWVLVMKPCSTAMLSLTFAEYLNRSFAFEEMPSIWVLRGIAWFTVVFITFLNCMGTRASTDTTNIFLVIKLTGVCSIIVTGLVLFVGGVQHEPEIPATPGQDPNSGLWGHLGAYTDATLAALWAYSGWEHVS